MNKFLRNNQGISIIEVMVTVGIIVIVSSIVLANYSAGEKNSKLALTVQKVESNIRLAQSYTLGLFEFNGALPVGGWGLRFKEGDSFYTMFADKYDGENGNHVYDEFEGELFKQIDLPSGFTVSQVITAPDSDIADITFMPPDPVTYINGEYDQEARIVISDGTETRVIRVNFFGLIEVED